jgi:predicted negative regulator of RcsB-dependent stress response
MGSFAAWNGWNYWQRSQSAKAAALFDEIQRAADAKDAEKIERALGEMKDRFASTAFAAQGGLLAGKTLFDAGKLDSARAALAWVAEKSPDEAHQAVARLRLAGLEVEAKAYDQALKQLDAPVPESFKPLVADRRGDVLMAQGKSDEAKAQYQIAWAGLGTRSDYRQMVEVKLAALGVDVSTLAPAKEGTP